MSTFGGASIDLRPGGEITMRWDEHGTFQAVVEAVTPGELEEPKQSELAWRNGLNLLAELAHLDR